MKCGKCGSSHATAAEVKACYTGGTQQVLTLERPAVQQQQTPKVEVPDGYYAVPSATGNNDLDFYRLNHGKPGGKWEHFQFVTRIIGGHPEFPVKGSEGRAAKERIAAYGYEAAGMLYASELGNCYICNKTLTDELSRQLGIGPVCRKKVEE